MELGNGCGTNWATHCDSAASCSSQTHDSPPSSAHPAVSRTPCNPPPNGWRRSKRGCAGLRNATPTRFGRPRPLRAESRRSVRTRRSGGGTGVNRRRRGRTAGSRGVSGSWRVAGRSTGRPAPTAPPCRRGGRRPRRGGLAERDGIARGRGGGRFGDPIRVLNPPGRTARRRSTAARAAVDLLGAAGRPAYQVLSTRDLALLAGWDGQLAAFAEKELSWRISRQSHCRPGGFAFRRVPARRDVGKHAAQPGPDRPDTMEQASGRRHPCTRHIRRARRGGHLLSHLALKVDLTGGSSGCRRCRPQSPPCSLRQQGDELLLLRRDRT